MSPIVTMKATAKSGVQRMVSMFTKQPPIPSLINETEAPSHSSGVLIDHAAAMAGGGTHGRTGGSSCHTGGPNNGKDGIFVDVGSPSFRNEPRSLQEFQEAYRQLRLQYFTLKQKKACDDRMHRRLVERDVLLRENISFETIRGKYFVPRMLAFASWHKLYIGKPDPHSKNLAEVLRTLSTTLKLIPPHMRPTPRAWKNCFNGMGEAEVFRFGEKIAKTIFRRNNEAGHPPEPINVRYRLDVLDGMDLPSEAKGVIEGLLLSEPRRIEKY